MPATPKTMSEIEVTCPYCGETVVIILDPAGGGTQDYVEDCEVCCKPISIEATADEEGAVILSLMDENSI